MPTSQTRVLKLLFATIFNPRPHFYRPILSYRYRSSLPFLILRHFSSIDGGIKAPTKDEQAANESFDSFQNPPEPIPNRPLRGERPFNRQSNRVPEINNQSNFRGEIKGRGRSGNPNFSNKFDNGNEDVGVSKKSSRSFEFLNRPLGDEKKRVNQSDESFLEKFKLGLDKSEKISEEQKGDSDQVLSEPLPPPQDSDEIFKKMKETGLIPNAVAMLDGLCKDGLVQEAMKLFGSMREKGTIPEVVIYTAVVDGFCKAHKLDDAKRIFRKMQANGISPNAFSYTVLIQGLYRSSKLEDAIEFCMEMIEAGHSPNVATFTGLVDGLCREKGVEEAQRVISDLRQKGFFVNEKAVREFLDKRALVSSMVWEAIFGKKTSTSSI